MRVPWSRSQPAAAATPERPRAPVQRKPRILIAGEFSAGKTQLINGLVGGSVLPSNVTATALPPVWLVRGEPALMRVGFSGRGEPIADLGAIDLDKTQYCVLSNPSSALTQMDIIDTPGNSDPNMAAETWQRMLTFADAVVWCTNATQAWRQSEKAVWQAMPARLRQNATIVVTHADLLNGAGTADRVLQRVQREASAFFDTFIMASLLERNDLDRITAHLRNLSGSLKLDGAANALTGEFAAAHPVRAVAPAQSPAQPPAPAAPVVQPAAAVPSAAAQAAPEVARPVPGANVLHMIRPRRPAAPPAEVAPAAPVVRPAAAAPQPAPAAASKGIARLLWDELSKNLDRNDPVAVLAAVERLVGRLDAHIGTAATANTTPVKGTGLSGSVAETYE